VSDSNDEHWERKVLEKIALEAIAEQRRGRRWGIFFKFLTFGFLFVLLGLFSRSTHLDEKVGVAGRHTALIDVQGVIAEGEEAQADSIVTALRSAFDEKHVAGIVLRINSPGGSPVQAGYVYDEIKRLRALHPQAHWGGDSMLLYFALCFPISLYAKTLERKMR